MSTKYFQQFEKIYYKFGDETSYSLMQNLTQYVDIIDQVKPQQAFIEDYTIKSGDRPDTLSLLLYGDTQYYWTFYLMNDHLRESGWPLMNEEVLDRAKKYYPHRVVTSTNDLATASGNPPRDFSVGRQVIGQVSGTVGTIVKRNLDLGQLIIDTTNAFTTSDKDFELTVNSNGFASIEVEHEREKFDSTDLWILQKYDMNYPQNSPVVVHGWEVKLDSLSTEAELQNIPFEIGTGAGFKYVLTARVNKYNEFDSVFEEGEQIYFRDPGSGMIVFARIHKETSQYNAVHHYENADGEWVDIDPFEEVIPSGLISVTNLARLQKKNDELKQIKCLKTTSVDSVVKEFYKLMNNR